MTPGSGRQDAGSGPNPTWIAVAFVGLQLLFVFAVGPGPFRDEAFYITSGLQLWSGADYPAERYLTWFNGSPYAWPAAAGVAYGVGGVAAARLLALACFVGSVAFAWAATRTLLGPAAAFWAVALVAAKGSSLILGHYATYDLASFAALGFALWCVVRWVEAPRIVWAVLAGLGIGLAAIAKYPYAVMGLPLAAMLLALGGRRALGAVAVLTIAAAAPFLTVTWAQFGALVPTTLSNYDHASFPRPLVALVMGFYTVIPVGLIGLALARLPDVDPRARRLLWVGLGSALLWPALHMVTGQITSSFKHVWMGLLPAAPALGYAAWRLWTEAGRRRRAAALGVVLAVGVGEWFALEPLTYPHFRPSAEFLMERAGEGDAVLVFGNNDRWVYAMYLYGAGRVASPFDVVDQAADGRADPCDYDWVVATRTGLTGPLDTSGWLCPYELAFQNEQSFLNSRGAMDVQTFQVWRRLETDG